MKPYLEHIAAPEDSSWVLFDRQLDSIPFEWHYNSEYELTLTLHSRGQRFVGDNLSLYDHGDLVLIGPKIPHTWCSTERLASGQKHQALVLWFSDIFVKGMIEPHTELRPILKLLERSSRALTFSEQTRRSVQPLICALTEQNTADRLLTLLRVLLILADDNASVFLTSSANQTESFPGITEERIGRAIRHLHAHYREELSIAALSRVAGLSRSSLHRLFKLQTGMTVSAYVTQLRIGHACALLLNAQQPIALIAEEVGYKNLANFNRQFKALKRHTPREFRTAFRR